MLFQEVVNLKLLYSIIKMVLHNICLGREEVNPN